MTDYSQNVGDIINKYCYTIKFIVSTLIINNGDELVYKNLYEILYFIISTLFVFVMF